MDIKNTIKSWFHNNTTRPFAYAGAVLAGGTTLAIGGYALNWCVKQVGFLIKGLRGIHVPGKIVGWISNPVFWKVVLLCTAGAFLVGGVISIFSALTDKISNSLPKIRSKEKDKSKEKEQTEEKKNKNNEKDEIEKKKINNNSNLTTKIDYDKNKKTTNKDNLFTSFFKKNNQTENKIENLSPDINKTIRNKIILSNKKDNIVNKKDNNKQQIINNNYINKTKNISIQQKQL